MRSPDPKAKGAMVPLVSSFMLSTKEGRKAWVEPVIDPTAPDGWRFEVRTGAVSKADEERLKKGTKAGRGASFVCLLTGTALEPAYVRTQAQAGKMRERLLAVVADSGRGRIFLTSDQVQAEASEIADPVDRPDETLHKNSRYMTPTIFGLEKAGDLFLTRQIVALNELSYQLKRLAPVIEHHLESCSDYGRARYRDALLTSLALCISRQANRSSTLCFWDTEGHNVQQVFARQALSMTWDFVESNPFSDSTGNFLGQVEYFARVIAQSGAAGTFGSIEHSAAQRAMVPENAVISTDPPYYDNVPYADISDFFYVWLRRSLREIYPTLFARILTPKDEELVAFPERHGNQDNADNFFIEGMKCVFDRLYQGSSSDYPTAIYYAFRQSEAEGDAISSPGWATFLQSVISAGYVIDGTWPVRTELVGNLKKKKNALASSIVLVCRKRPYDAPVATRAEFIRALRRELPEAVAAIRRGGVGPVDMQQSVIGPGMGVFTRYARVLEDDDSAMPVRTALSLINRAWDEIENEAAEALDAVTQVALAWFAAYGFDARPTGDLITLANAKNLPIGALFAAKLFEDRRGRAALMPRDQLPVRWTPAGERHPTAWACVQHAVRVLNAEDGGAEAAAALVAAMGRLAEPARALAYRLFQVATERGWAAEALAYNALAEEWPRLLDMAPRPAAPAQAEMFAAGAGA